MSVFCSNTLIFAPECWKCTLRSPAFKIFQGVMPPNRTPLVTHTFSAHKSCPWHEFFPSLPTQKLLPSTVPLKSKLTLEARNSRLDPHLSKLERFEFRYARIESRDARNQVSSFDDRGSRIQEARFSERTMLYSHVAVQIVAQSISACSAVFCNCLNCRGSPSFQYV